MTGVAPAGHHGRFAMRLFTTPFTTVLSGDTGMSSRRVRSISTKVTEDEYAQLAARAGAQTISEWARTILLKPAAPDPSVALLLGEVLAMRTILLNLHFALSTGVTPTADMLQGWIARADRDKLRQVEQRLRADTLGSQP
jgi:hypothetical protein